jgi:hypothetical protein
MEHNDFVMCTNENGLIMCEGFRINNIKQDDNPIYKNLVATNWAFCKPPSISRKEYTEEQDDQQIDDDLYEKLLTMASISTENKHKTTRKHSKKNKQTHNTSKKEKTTS